LSAGASPIVEPGNPDALFATTVSDVADVLPSLKCRCSDLANEGLMFEADRCRRRRILAGPADTGDGALGAAQVLAIDEVAVE
jgi:hypothetical protein